MSSELKYALFDIDGTVLNSADVWHSISKKFLLSKGIEEPDDLRDLFASMQAMQIVSYLKNKYQLDDSVQDIIEYYNLNIHDYYEHEAKLKENIIDILEGLTKQGYKIYVVSSANKQMISQTLERLKVNQYFIDVFASNDLRATKDEKVFYDNIITKLNANIDDFILFADTQESALAAKASGLKVLGIYDEKVRGDIRKIVDRYINEWEDLL